MVVIIILMYILTVIGAGLIAGIRLQVIDSALTNPVYRYFIATLVIDVLLFVYNSLDARKKSITQKDFIVETVIRAALDEGCNLLLRDDDNGYSVRSCVLLFKKDFSKIKITYMSSNMLVSEDNELEFEKWQGCSGNAWGYRAPVVARLTAPTTRGQAPWGLTEEQARLTQGLTMIICVPIIVESLKGANSFKRWFYSVFGNRATKPRIIGIISFDTSDQLADNFFFREEAVRSAVQISHQVAGLLTLYQPRLPSIAAPSMNDAGLGLTVL